jgi:hypothetical protein
MPKYVLGTDQALLALALNSQTVVTAKSTLAAFCERSDADATLSWQKRDPQNRLKSW